MTIEESIDLLAELNPEALLADGFEDAYIGFTSTTHTAVYNRDKCIEGLMTRQGLKWEDAEEFFTFNVEGSYVGPFTPIFLEQCAPA